MSAALATAPFWLGTSFDGLPLTTEQRGTYIYGTCEPKPDSGCSPPLQVQNRNACDRNPVGLDVAPSRIRRFRGAAIAWSLERGAVDISTGRSNATVYAYGNRGAERAARALRRRSQSRPARLAAPAFPPAVLRELKRVTVAREELGTTVAVGYALGIPRRFVRVRLRVARLLPAGALGGVSVPRRSWAAVQRDRQVAYWVHDFGVRRAMERFSLSGAQVRHAVSRVQGLAGDC